MGRIKLCILNPTMSFGGAEKYLVNLIKYLDKEKFEIILKPISHEGVLKDLSFPDNITYKPIFKNIFNPNKRIKGTTKILDLMFKIIPDRIVYKLLIRDKVDIIINNHGLYGLKLASYCNHKDIKKIAFVHNDFSTISDNANLQPFTSFDDLTKCYKTYDTIVHVSEGSKQNFINRLKLNDEKNINHEVLYHINNKEDIQKKANEPIEIIKKRFTVCCVGRLIEDKGIQNIIKAIYIMKNKGFNMDLWIVGDGNYRTTLEKQVKELKLDENVVFIGYSDNPYKYINKSDLVCNGSYSESLSIIILEAFELDKPVVTTPVSSAKELIGNNEYGIITNGFSAESISIALKEIYSNDKLYKLYCKKNSIWKENFSKNALLNRAQKILSDGLEKETN